MQSTEIKTESPKLTIKEIIREERTFEKEVNLPHYCKSPNSYSHYKIVSENSAIKVSDWGFQCEIVMRESVSHLIADAVDSNETEFQIAYETVLSKIQNQTL
jgi:hypothetical protein